MVDRAERTRAVGEEAALRRALTEVERPKAADQRPTGQTLLIRLYGSRFAHRVIPTPVALRLAALRGRAEWYLVPHRRAYALRRTEVIRGIPSNSSAATFFARRRLVEDAVRAELQWRPWLSRKMTIEGFAHIQAARAGGRGAIVATVHLGPFLALVHGLAARGIKLYVCGGTWGGGAAPMHGRRGRWTLAQNRWVEEAGCRWVHPGGSYPLLRELLMRGEVCVIAVDALGKVDVDLAGHPARVRGGTASLALDTGASIVPGFVLRRGWGQVCVLLEPIDPSSFANPISLTRHLAKVLGDALLEAPEQVHDSVFDRWEAVSRLEKASPG